MARSRAAGGCINGGSLVAGVAGGEAQVDRLAVIEGIRGGFDGRGQGATGELLEVEQAGVAPDAGVLFLPVEALADFGRIFF